MVRTFTNVNVRTMVYDHTFAFPRLIWYVAIFCFIAMGYAVDTMIISIVIVTAVYIFIGYAYYYSIQKFLTEFPDLRKYYRKQWWAVLLLPLFNFLVFFFRVLGILNSINTTSAWKTRNLTQEREAFVAESKKSLSFIMKPLMRFRKAINYEE